jgi:hypothetical protein
MATGQLLAKQPAIWLKKWAAVWAVERLPGEYALDA